MKTVTYFYLLVLFSAIHLNETAPNHRRRRQAGGVGDAGDALVDAVFQIPIQTLTAVGTLVKSSRPVIMQVRQRIQQTLVQPQRQQPHRFSFPGTSGQQQQQQSQQSNRRISSAYQPTSHYTRLYQQPNTRVSSGKQSSRRHAWDR